MRSDADRPLPEPPFDPFVSRSRTRNLVEQLPVVIYVDTDERFPECLYITPNIEKVLGFSLSAILSDRGLWARNMHPDDRPRVRAIRDEAWERGTQFRAEYRMIRPDGEEVWLRDSSVLVLSDDGIRLAWQGVIEDLTTEKRSQEHMRASEARYRALIERVPAVVYEMDPDDERRTLYVSPHVEEVLGYSRAEWLGQPDIWIELLHEDDREVVLAAHDRNSETGEPWDIEYRLIASDGRVVWVHDRATLIRGQELGSAAWHGVMIDVTTEHEAREMLLLHKEDLERRVKERTNELQDANELMGLEIGERRRMEQELRRVEERYRELVENMPGIAYVWDLRADTADRAFTYVSTRVHDVLGFPIDEWRPEERIHPHDRARVAEAAARSARTGAPMLIEYRFLAKDGTVVWVLDSASLISRTEHGHPSLFQGVILDITARKEAESKAEQAEDRYRELTERGPVVAYTFELTYEQEDWPPDVAMTYVSPRSADLVGYPVSYWLNDWRIWIEMIHPDDRERVMEDTEGSWRTGRAWSLHYRVIRGDGELIWLHDTGRMLQRDADGRPSRFIGVLLDSTEDQQSRTRLQLSEESHRGTLEGVGAIPWTETIHPETGEERSTYIGPQAIEITGYTPEELSAERKHFPRMVHPDDRAHVMDSVAVSEETGLWEATYRILRRDGGIRWLHAFGRRVSKAGELPEVWQGVSVDVTALRAEGSEDHGTEQPTRSDVDRR